MIDDHAVLGKEAHALVSMTGVLGFTALAEACRGLEKACQTGGELNAALAAIGQASVVCLHAASDLAAFRDRELTSEQLAG
jgi:HPt (histidine-containing phosphotransfer) domain-containing protein